MLPDFNNISDLLIIRLSSLGDVILTTPLVRAIKLKYPHLRINFLVKENYYDVLRHNPYIKKTFLYEKELAGLKSHKFDLVIDLQNNRRSSEVAKSFGVDVLSFKKPQLAKFLLVHFKINRFDKIIKIPERYAESVPNVKVEAPPEIFTGDVNASMPEDIIDGKIIGLCPGSRHFTKMWPVEYYKSLAEKLTKDGYVVVIFGGNSDIDVGNEIAESTSGVYNLANNNKLLETVGLMKKCEAVVCNDSGMMHTATAAGVPVLAIFGSTVKEFGFEPFSAQAEIAEVANLSCRPCSHIGRASCPKKHFRCMRELTPELIYQKLKNLLKTHD